MLAGLIQWISCDVFCLEGRIVEGKEGLIEFDDCRLIKISKFE